MTVIILKIYNSLFLHNGSRYHNEIRQNDAYAHSEPQQHLKILFS